MKIKRLLYFQLILIFIFVGCKGKTSTREVELAKETGPRSSGEEEVTPFQSSEGAREEPILGEKPPLELPKDWPTDIPILAGLKLIHVDRNPQGGISLVFEGRVAEEEVRAHFANAMKDWTSVKVPFSMESSGPGLKLAFVKGDRTALILLSPPDSEKKIILNLMYNCFVPPGKLPQGWLPDVPVMPEFKVTGSMVMPDGSISVNAEGNLSLESVAAFYKEKLASWRRVEPEGTPDILGDRLVMTFQKGSDRMVVLAFLSGSQTALVLALSRNVSSPR